MNFLPKRDSYPAWILLLMSIAGFIFSKPSLQPYEDLSGKTPLNYTYKGEPIYIVADFYPENWDEIYPAMEIYSRELINNNHNLYFFTTNLLLIPSLEILCNQLNHGSITQDLVSKASFEGFLPGYGASIIELFRDPGFVIPNIDIDKPSKRLFLIFSGDENYHLWFFYAWGRYKSRLIMILPSMIYPEARIYKNSGQVIELFQSIVNIDDKDINRRKSSISWFALSLLFLTILRLLRNPLKNWWTKQTKYKHKRKYD